MEHNAQLARVAEIAKANADAAIDQKREYDDSISAYAQNVRDTLHEEGFAAHTQYGLKVYYARVSELHVPAFPVEPLTIAQRLTTSQVRRLADALRLARPANYLTNEPARTAWYDACTRIAQALELSPADASRFFDLCGVPS